MATVPQLVDYCRDLLRVREIEDWPNALNGLQIENAGAVTKIGAAVDASTRTIEAAIKHGINFLIVHHGLFWPGLQPITGGRRRMLERAFEHDLALYSAHLPLDVHSVLGNNAQLASALGFEDTEPFFEQKGQCVGLKVKAQVSRDELAQKLEHSLGGPVAADELGINLLLGGHYATETFGVKALAAHLADRFDLPWEFLDFPTGL